MNTFHSLGFYISTTSATFYEVRGSLKPFDESQTHPLVESFILVLIMSFYCKRFFCHSCHKTYQIDFQFFINFSTFKSLHHSLTLPSNIRANKKPRFYMIEKVRCSSKIQEKDVYFPKTQLVKTSIPT